MSSQDAQCGERAACGCHCARAQPAATKPTSAASRCDHDRADAAAEIKSSTLSRPSHTHTHTYSESALAKWRVCVCVCARAVGSGHFGRDSCGGVSFACARCWIAAPKPSHAQLAAGRCTPTIIDDCQWSWHTHTHAQVRYLRACVRARHIVVLRARAALYRESARALVHCSRFNEATL